MMKVVLDWQNEETIYPLAIQPYLGIVLAKRSLLSLPGS